MLTGYALYEIDTTNITTPDQWNEAMNKMPDRYFNKLYEIEAYCGVKLRRGRLGYYGSKGNIEYSVYKIVSKKEKTK